MTLAKKTVWFALMLGDSIAILLVILLGFSFHQTDAADRLQFTLFPFLSSWLFSAWALGLFASSPQWNQLWRVPLAMLVAAALGGWLRSAWLSTPLAPIFVLVLGLTLTLALLAWRVLFIFFVLRRTNA